MVDGFINSSGRFVPNISTRTICLTSTRPVFAYTLKYRMLSGEPANSNFQVDGLTRIRTTTTEADKFPSK